MDNLEATFLNVDLDLRGDAVDVARVISAMAASVVVLRHDGGEASLELAEQFSTAESTLHALAEFVRLLPGEARSAWDRLEYRRADIGLQHGSRGEQLTGTISLEVLGMLIGCRIELAYTVY